MSDRPLTPGNRPTAVLPQGDQPPPATESQARMSGTADTYLRSTQVRRFAELAAFRPVGRQQDLISTPLQNAWNEAFGHVPLHIVAMELRERMLFQSTGYYRGIEAGLSYVYSTLGEPLSVDFLDALHTRIADVSCNEFGRPIAPSMATRAERGALTGFDEGNLTDDGLIELAEWVERCPNARFGWLDDPDRPFLPEDVTREHLVPPRPLPKAGIIRSRENLTDLRQRLALLSTTYNRRFRDLSITTPKAERLFAAAELLQDSLREHPFTDANGRLTLFVLTQKLMIENALSPVRHSRSDLAGLSRAETVAELDRGMALFALARIAHEPRPDDAVLAAPRPTHQERAIRRAHHKAEGWLSEAIEALDGINDDGHTTAQLVQWRAALRQARRQPHPIPMEAMGLPCGAAMTDWWTLLPAPAQARLRGLLGSCPLAGSESERRRDAHMRWLELGYALEHSQQAPFFPRLHRYLRLAALAGGADQTHGSAVNLKILGNLGVNTRRLFEDAFEVADLQETAAGTEHVEAIRKWVLGCPLDVSNAMIFCDEDAQPFLSFEPKD